jgi:adenosine/AMP kinase
MMLDIWRIMAFMVSINASYPVNCLNGMSGIAESFAICRADVSGS